MKNGTIQWNEWGDEAFERAEREGKPILLAIGAVWCHWCHVMDRTTYAEPEVVALVNERFVPVRVDNDRRPDINRRYNMGGWPTTAFLNAKGAVLTGFTYMPAARFKHVLREVSQAYARMPEYRDRPYDAGILGEYGEPAAARGKVSYDIVEETLDAIVRSFDREYGGFGLEPKFPHADALDFLMEIYARTGRAELLDVVMKTLDGMASAGMYDCVMGGFFRYSTTRDWSVPHFEKMLEDNARLLGAYAAAYRLAGKREYRKTAMGIIGYLDSTLWRESGGYFGSQDADEEYYALGLDERRARAAPRVDRAVYVNWNALAASSFIRASYYLDEPAMRDRARAVLDMLLRECYVRGEGMCHYLDDHGPHGGGLFEDQVWMCSALLDAFLSSAFQRGGADYLKAAWELMDVCLDGYWDETHGAFFDIASTPRQGSKGGLCTRLKSLHENARAAEVLRRMASMANLRTSRDEDSRREPEYYLEKAEACLDAFAKSWRKYGLLAAPYAAAVLHYLHPVSVEIGDGSGVRTTPDMVERLSREFIPWVDVLPGSEDGSGITVCSSDRCFAPAETVDEAVQTIRSASSLS